MLKWFYFLSRNREEKVVFFFVRGEVFFVYKCFLVYLFFFGIFGFFILFYRIIFVGDFVKKM